MSVRKTYKQRTYLDPIHGPIQLNLKDELEELLVKIIDTKEFQRLRRIRQMGTGWFTFHGAEHTRFGHSLGSLFIARKIVQHLSKSRGEISKFLPQILSSALLHDIGHGPLSHTAEKLVPISHEKWAKYFLLGDTEINTLLKGFSKTLPLAIIKTIEKKDTPLYVSQIVSSYIDCDRLDYLYRDSYYVGVPYGLTGSDRIIASLEIDSKINKLVVNESIGLDAVIHYLHARYSMYQQVYQHKKNLACDFLIRKIIERIREAKPLKVPSAFWKWVNAKETDIEKLGIDFYFMVDDYLLISTLQGFVYNEEEKILSDLSNRLLTRRLFKSLEFRPDINKNKIKEITEKIKEVAEKKNMHPDYYLGIEESASKPYEPYEPSKGKNDKSVYIKQKNGEIKELSKVSGLVKALSEENVVKTCLVFAPEFEDEVMKTKGILELVK